MGLLGRLMPPVQRRWYCDGQITGHTLLQTGRGLRECTCSVQLWCLLENGDGIRWEKSLAGHYFKLSVDQRNAAPQFRYGVLLNSVDGIDQDKSLAAYYFKLSANQGNAAAQFKYGVFLNSGDGIDQDTSLFL